MEPRRLTMRLRTLSIVGVIALMASLPGCGGGGAKVQSEISTTTKGQQLLDLKKAFDNGAINQKEYEEQRKRILEN
jgi:putative oligomerization/nucleic acid binding protein